MGPEIGYKFAKKKGAGLFFEPSIGYNFLISGKDKYDSIKDIVNDTSMGEEGASDFDYMKFIDPFLGKGFVFNLTLGISF